MLSKCCQKRRTDSSSDGVSNPASELRCTTDCKAAFIRQAPYCNSLSGQAPERGGLDWSEAQGPPAGVSGELAQEGGQGPASYHVDFLHGFARQLLAEIDCASIRKRKTLQDAAGDLGGCLRGRHVGGRALHPHRP